MVKKIRKGFESMQGDFQNHGQYGQGPFGHQSPNHNKKNDGDAIEAEFRKL